MNDILKAIVYGGLFAIPFLTLFVAKDYFFPFITGKNFAFRIIVELVFVAWAVLALLDTTYRPKFSWILSSFSVLLGVMFFANMFGVHPESSFWSNFERMDGYITLVHVFLYVVVLGSVFTTKKAWNWYLHTTLAVALIAAIYGVAQYTGVVEGREGSRIESYLGNAAYFSIYMLFHIFIAFWMFVESKVTLHRVVYILLSVLFIYALMNSGTRGTVLGFGAGLAVMGTPVLGWGQSNFNFVFNEQYNPFLFNQEQWFDRSHNIFMDWLVTGGFLGLFAYLSIFVAALYYLFVEPFLRREKETFTVLERGVLIGILAGYFTHNIVVFDNIVSYMFFALILALIHSRVGQVMPSVEKFKIDPVLVKQFVAPVAALLVVFLVYTLHLPGMHAASDIIEGYRATADPVERLEAYERAVNRNSFAQQEIAEQVAQQAMSIIRNEQVSEEVRMKYVELAIRELDRLAKDKPGDARIHVFIGTFYRS